MSKTLTQWMKENGFTEESLAELMGYTHETIKKYLHHGKPVPTEFAVNAERFTKGEVSAVAMLERVKARKEITEQRKKLLSIRVDI